MYDVIWLVMYNDQQIAGVFKGQRLGNKSILVHVFIFKEFRGVGSEEWGKLGLEYIKNNYGITTVLAMTPVESAKHYAERCGYKQIGILKESIKIHGELKDQYLLECKL
jgi:hypothetical protein